jgi:hypothetical protein
MLTIAPIVRGESSSLRVTFLNSDTDVVINTTGWIFYMTLGRSRTSLGGLLEVSQTADAINGAQGQVTATLTAEQTGAITTDNAMVELLVDTGMGKKIPLLLASVLIQSPEQYRTQYYQTTTPANVLLEDVPTVIQGSALQPQEIKMSFSTSLDPTFDVGVMVKFSEPSAETINYIDAIAADITQKHTEIMGV